MEAASKSYKEKNSKRYFAKIRFRQKAIPHQNFFWKNSHKGLQLIKIYRHTACNFTKKEVKKIIED